MTATLDRLAAIVASRRAADPAESYVAKLFAKGRGKIAQKVGEEAVEAVIAAVGDDREGLIGESADLLFHLSVLWADMGITPDDIDAELARREGVSGIAEKAARKTEVPKAETSGD
ncbi:phosphoribosyl-ATP diphosphatase [Sphingosinicella microcystinivorans]|uniref:phosphoribosyl-ATP diphosphatase n=1 Tax=Sphingosinicella microcystinivorans TaxID=335406 RepID=UPI0022F39580|nr:phosphoribosyl-ATP diphosphatase [Sphingosinicella microcystinivorans]WBX85653.1 phosphoribosyl-ATP diphosphatase [Sphingosinicella microcystinivorans]